MAVVSTGFFDGVHLGHRLVLRTLVGEARRRGEESIVITFWPHPRNVLQNEARSLRLLTSLEEKKALMTALEVDRVEVLPFTKEFASMRAEEYLSLLRERFGASLVVMGYDNRIGSDGRSAKDFEDSEFVILSGAVDGADEMPISSTRIRNELLEGRIEEANAMLGYSYSLYGVVVAGNRMGRTIGFPTANIQLYEPLKLVPGNGVYAVEVEVNGGFFKGMCNIGTRPTVGGSARTIEVHILDFSEDIYGLPLKIRFLRRIRDERKFPSLEALREQLEKDRRICL
ncbi:MAG: riboflavin biosynthesis protein RibF [Bacteroidales bacterium]|nr:riboflavin biosynthesis protein RibF [Bacteroidales bacterium]